MNRKILGLAIASALLMCPEKGEGESAGGGASAEPDEKTVDKAADKAAAKAEKKAADRRPEANIKLNPAEYPGAIKSVAPKCVPGGEYDGRVDTYVVPQMAGAYGKTEEEVKADIEKAIAALPKSDVDPDVAAKKIAARKAIEKAVEAEKDAAEATAFAKRQRERADALMAEAEGRIVVMVPKPFGLNIGGQVIRYAPGRQTMPREHAEHSYAKAHGVEIVSSAPTKD